MQILLPIYNIYDGSILWCSVWCGGLKLEGPQFKSRMQTIGNPMPYSLGYITGQSFSHYVWVVWEVKEPLH